MSARHHFYEDPNREGLPSRPACWVEIDRRPRLGDDISVGQGLHRGLIDLFAAMLTDLRAELEGNSPRVLNQPGMS